MTLLNRCDKLTENSCRSSAAGFAAKDLTKHYENQMFVWGCGFEKIFVMPAGKMRVGSQLDRAVPDFEIWFDLDRRSRAMRDARRAGADQGDTVPVAAGARLEPGRAGRILAARSVSTCLRNAWPALSGRVEHEGPHGDRAQIDGVGHEGQLVACI